MLIIHQRITLPVSSGLCMEVQNSCDASLNSDTNILSLCYIHLLFMTIWHYVQLILYSETESKHNRHSTKKKCKT